MVEGRESFPDWDRNPRPPAPLPPKGSCDCQIHIYGDVEKYPPKLKINFDPPNATFEDSQRVHKVLGFDRAVIVHASIYDTDYRLLIDTLEGLEDRSNYRAAIVLKNDVPDSMLAKLDGLGVRGIRFHIASRYQSDSKDDVRRILARVRELGWHVRLHLDPPDFLEYQDVFDEMKGITYIIDHMGRLDFSQGLEQPTFVYLMDRLKNENWWMMVSNGNRVSAMDKGWDDAVPYGRAYLEAAPDRCIWCSDWPHVRWRKARMMNEAEPVELFYRYADNDPELIRKVLVDNPARLLGF
ncbi:MAG: hypothetical protein RLZ98_1634 [Pseudomonadota bacterium]